jgi:WD40 repeat protein
LKRVIDRGRLGPPIGPAEEIISIYSSGSGPRRFNIDIRDEMGGAASSVAIDMAVLSEDSERLVTAGSNKVHVWNAGDGTITHELDGALNVHAIADVPSEGLILALTEFTDRQHIAIRSQVRAWERYTGGLQYAVRIEGRGRALAVSPNGKLLAVISQSDRGPDHAPFAPGQASAGSIEVLEVITGSRVTSLPGTTMIQQNVALQFSADSAAIACIAGPEFRSWEVTSGETQRRFNLDEHSRIVPPGRPMAGQMRPTEFHAFAISPDLRWGVTTGLGDPRVFVWDVDKGAKHKELTIEGLFTSKLAVSGDSRLLAVSAYLARNTADNQRDEEHRSTITVWDIRQGTHLLTLQPDPKELPNAISFSPDGKYLLSASGAKSVIVWDLSEARAKLQ